MEILALINHFCDYAINLKELNHDPDPKKFRDRAFFHLDFEEIQSALREGCKFPLMLLITPEVGKNGDIDNLTEAWEASYLILDRCEKTSDKANCLDRCKKIADKVYSRMISDAGTFFDGSLVQTDEGMVGPTGDKLYGWIVSFGFTQAYNGELNSNDWEDLV